MTQTYRTDDVTRWGAGKGSDLEPAEFDINFWDIIQRLIIQEARPNPSAGIVSFAVVGANFYVHMSDATVLGPYALPVALYRNTGDWVPSFSYVRLDTFSHGGGLYAVNVNHVSAGSFDPGANNGVDDYYTLMLQTPGSSLPTGGATNQVMQKSTSSDFAVTWGWKLPVGGTSRQYLIKQSGTNQDSDWHTPEASDIHFTHATGSILTSTAVDNALEELAVLAGGAVTMADISDVLFATGDPHAGQLLQFDGTHWTAVAASAASGDVLKFDGTHWVPSTISFAQITGSPTTSQLRNPTVTALGTSGSTGLDPTVGDIFTVTPSGDINLTAGSTPLGAEVTIIIQAPGTTSHVITFNSGSFKSTGTLAVGTVAGKFFTIKFVCDGLYFYEVSRTTAM